MSGRDHKRKLTASAIWNAVPLLVSAATGLWLLSFAIPRLGLAHYGIYVTMIAAVSPLIMLLCGIPDAVIRSVARSLGQNDLPLAIGYAQAGSLLIAIGALLSTIIAALLLPIGSHLVLGTPDSTDTAFPILNCAFAVAATMLAQHLSTVPSSILSAMQRFRALSLCVMIQTVVTAASQVFAIENGFGISGFAWGAAIGSAISLVMRLIAIGVPSGFSWFVPRIRSRAFRELLVFGRWQSVAQLGGAAAAQAERICLAGLLGPAATTNFDLCVKAQTPLYTIVWQATQSLFPFLSCRASEGVGPNVLRTMRATWISTGATAIALIPLGGFSTQILTLWMGADIALAAAPIMTVLAVAGVVGAATNAPYQFLLAMGNTKTLATVSILTGLASIVSVLILIPILGLRGAGLPALIAMIVQWAYVNHVISKIGERSFRETAAGSAGPIAAAALMIAGLKTIEVALPSGSIGGIAACIGFGLMILLTYQSLRRTRAGRQGVIDLREMCGLLKSTRRVA